MVSAVITTHNRINLLPNAIRSIEEQTYKDIEIIVVDDASNDGTEEYCRGREGIVYIRISQEESRGGNYARNLGIQRSSGEYIAFLDDDDEWYPNKIEKQLELFSDSKVGMVYCELHVDVGVKFLNYNIAFFKEGNLFEKKQYWNPICTTSAMMFKREVFESIGGFDEAVRYWQEYELSLRVIPKFEIKVVKEPLVLYRKSLNDKAKLTNNFSKWEESVEYIVNKHRAIFNLLGKEEKKKFKEFYYTEAAYRSGAIGRRDLMQKFYKEAFYLTGKFEYYIRWKLNISRQQTAYIEPVIKKIIYRKRKRIS